MEYDNFVFLKAKGKLIFIKLEQDQDQLRLPNKKISQIYIKSSSLSYIDIRANNIKRIENVYLKCPSLEIIDISDNPIDNTLEEIKNRLNMFRLFSFNKLLYNQFIVKLSSIIVR